MRPRSFSNRTSHLRSSPSHTTSAFPASFTLRSRHQGGERVEAREHGFPPLRRETEARALEAGRRQRVQPGLLGRREEDGNGRRLRVAPGLVQPLAQLGNPLDGILVRPHDWHPAVAELDDAVERGGAVAADEDRRVGLLRPPWGGPDLFEVHQNAPGLRLPLVPALLPWPPAPPPQAPAPPPPRAPV